MYCDFFLFCTVVNGLFSSVGISFLVRTILIVISLSCLRNRPNID